MAIFSDVIDEWKKASGKEKLLIAGGGAAVVVLALYLHSKSSSQSQPTGTGTTGVGGSFQPSIGGTGSPGSTSSPPPNDGGTGSPGTTGSNFQGTIRAAGLFPGYDSAHGGVPIRSAPGGAIIGYAPFQSVLSIFGTTSGPSNQFADPSAAAYGSTTWYQVFFNGVQAWVSAADVALSPVSQPALPPGSVQPLASARRVVQPNTTMNVYANTRHSPSVVPVRTLQAPPGPPAKAH